MNPEDSQAADVVKKCLHEIGEHFDCVQILASRSRDGGTDRCFQGVGNAFGRLGMAQDYVNEDHNKELSRHIADELNAESDDE